MKERILMVAVLDQPQSTNVSQAKAFMDLGYEVIPINYRTLITNYGTGLFYSTLKKAVDEYNPYLIMFCKCNGLDSAIIDELSKTHTTMLWMPDVINENMQRYPEIIEHAKRSSFSTCTGKDVVRYFKEHEVENCYHVFDGVDTDIFKPVDADVMMKADISFIGTKLPERDQYLELLSKAGFEIRAYGNGYGGEVFNDTFAKICSSSDYMLSINTINIPHTFSNRLFRYLGCQACTLHFDPTKTLHDYFKDGDEILFFADVNELITKLKFFKNKRIQIAEAGYKLVTTKYTWHEACKQVLELAERYKR